LYVEGEARVAIIEIPVEEWGSADYARVVPGSRVEYRGSLWIVVGVYFPRHHGAPENGSDAVSPAQTPTKHLILEPLDLSPESTQSLGAAHVRRGMQRRDRRPCPGTPSTSNHGRKTGSRRP
jgi:hypothetical protein